MTQFLLFLVAAMATRAQALVNPKLLEWSRKTAGFDRAAVAEKLQLPVDRLTAWETGLENPSIAQARKLSELYKRQLAVFFLPAPPETDDAMKDFRRLAGSLENVGPELRKELRRARARRDIALDLYSNLGESPLLFDASAHLADDPEAIGAKIRAVLNADWFEQLSWRSPDNAYGHWTAKAEAAGILVFHASGVPLEEFRGVALYEFPLPAVVINNRDATNGRTFTLLHEIVHLMLYNGDPLIERSGTRHDASETFANAAAAAALLPAKYVADDPDVADRRTDDHWSDPLISRVATRFKVSREAFVLRLAELGYVTRSFYLKKRALYRTAWMNRPKNEDGSGPPQHIKALSAGGRAFSRLVVESYRLERITGSEAANYLELKLKHLPNLEQALMPRPGRAA